MKIILIVLFYLTYSYTYSQKDTLSKYSYEISGIGDFRQLSDFRRQAGTGFFIRHENNLYFVTAKHVLLGCEGYNRIKNPAKELFIFIPKSTNKPFIKIELKNVKDTFCALIPKTPDISTYQVDGRYNDTSIHSIEDLIDSNEIGKIDSIAFYGFPHSITPIKKLENVSFGNVDYISNHKYYDSINGLMQSDITEYVFRLKTLTMDLSKLHGHSGSPVFIKEEGSIKWRMVGLIIRYIGFDKIGVLRKSFIYDSIQNHK